MTPILQLETVKYVSGGCVKSWRGINCNYIRIYGESTMRRLFVVNARSSTPRNVSLRFDLTNGANERYNEIEREEKC